MTKAIEGKFALVPATDHKTETELQNHKKNILAFAKGVRTGANQIFTYAYLAGREMLLTKPKVPHGNSDDPNGGFKQWIEQNFSDGPVKIEYRTAARWMMFAGDIKLAIEARPDAAKLVPLLGKKKLTAKEQSAILDLIPQVMDGKGMVAFMRDMKLLKDPEAPQHHPRKELSPEEVMEAETLAAQSTWRELVTQHRTFRDSLERLDPETRTEVFDESTATVERLVRLFTPKQQAEALEKLVAITTALRCAEKTGRAPRQS